MSFFEKTRPWWILCGLGIAGMIINIDFTIVSTVLPTLQKSLNARVSDLQWMMGAFGISFATLLTITGRIGDLFGRRKILYLAMSGFLLTSIGAGVSTSATELILFRFLQGLFAAPIFPCGMGILSEVFPQKTRGKALGIYTAIVGIGLASGPVVGGLIVTALSWRWIFFINIPVILLSFLICLPLLHESKKQEREKIDWVGMFLFIFGFGFLIFAITEGSNYGWKTPLILGSFLASAILLILFFFVENRVEEPIIPFKFFHNRSFLLGTGIAISAVAPLWAFAFLMPLYLQNALGLSPGISGVILLAMTVMTVLAPPLGGMLLDRKGAKCAVLTLFAFLFASYILFLFFSTIGPLWLILLAFALFGFGWGVGNAVSVTLPLKNLSSHENAGIVSGALVTVLNVVGVFLLAVITTIFRHSERGQLHTVLQEEGIVLNASQEHLVRTYLSDPEQAGNILQDLSPDLVSAILSHFRESFVSGFHVAIGILSLFILMIFFLILKPLFQES